MCGSGEREKKNLFFSVFTFFPFFFVAFYVHAISLFCIMAITAASFLEPVEYNDLLMGRRGTEEYILCILIFIESR